MGVLLVLIILIVSYIKNEVVELTDQNMNDYLTQHPKTLVMFYADWCAHCQKFMKPYHKLAMQLENKANNNNNTNNTNNNNNNNNDNNNDNNNNNNDIKIAKINASKQKVMAQQYNIRSYPSFRFFNGKDDISYFRRGSIPNMLNQLQMLQKPAYQVYSSLQAFEEHKKNNTKYKLFVLYKGNEQSPLGISFIELSKKRRQSKVKYCLISNDNNPQITFYKDYDEKEVEWSDQGGTVEQLKQWVDRHSTQLVRRIDIKGITSLLKLNVPVIIVRTENQQQGQLIQQQLEQMKYQLNKQQRVLLTYSQDQKVNKYLADDIGGVFPLVLRVLTTQGDNNYILTGSPTLSNLQTQLSLFYEGLLEQYYKSEQEPTQQLSSVYKVVYNSYEKEVEQRMQQGIDVVMLFHAKWCAYCTKIKPKYNRLAQELQQMKGVVLAMYDNENNASVYDVEYYPTIVLYSRGKRRKMKQMFSRSNFIQFYNKYGQYRLGLLGDEGQQQNSQQLEQSNQQQQIEL